MSDLISRSALLEAIKGVEVAWYLDGNYSTYDDSTIVEIIEEQPTAYDVDKVVGQLEEARTKRFVTGITHDAYEFGACHAIDVAIEIVRKGGVE